MTTDLFQKVAKKEELRAWLKRKGFVSSHEIVAWGLQNGHLRADRTKRDLVKEGCIRRLPKSEKAFRGFTFKDAVYEWVANGKFWGNDVL